MAPAIRNAIPEAADDILEQATGRGVPDPELGERIALEHGDGSGDQERHPHRRAGDFAGSTEQREDAGADHGADPDERRLPRREVGATRSVGHHRACAGLNPLDDVMILSGAFI